jgi:flagellar motor protein MotB
MPHRKKKHEEHANHERWVVSYADFITLLFAFFVVLYAISEVDKKKLKTVNNSVKFAFHYKGTGGTNEAGIYDRSKNPNSYSRGGIIGNLPMWAQQSPDAIKFFVEVLPEAYSQSGGGGDLEVNVQDDHAIVIKVAGSFLFSPGSSKPKPQAITFLEKIAQGAREVYGKTTIVVRTPHTNRQRTTSLVYERVKSMDEYLCSLFSVPVERVVMQVQKVDPRDIGPVGDVIAGWEEHTTVEFIVTG